MIKKIHKSMMPFLMVFLVSVLVACSDKTPDPQSYSVYWVVNGVGVEEDTNVIKGTQPSYDKEVPTKASDENYTYTFSGWSTTDHQEIGTIEALLPAVNADVTYFAAFSKTALTDTTTYMITWKDADGTILETTRVDKDTLPTRDLPSDTAQWTYTGWSPTIVAASSDAIYTATRTKQIYTITWEDTDGTILKTEQLAYGQTPSFDLPDDTNTWNYTSWSPSVTIVTQDITYIAQREVKEYTISNVVLVDNDDLKIVVLSAYEGRYSGFYLDMYYENKTTDKELMFSLRDTVVNGYVISSLWVDSLEAGESGNDEIWLSTSHLEQSGITSIDRIELFIKVYDSNDWFADDFINQKFTIYPTGLEDSEVISPERPTFEDERILVNNDELAIIILDTYVDRIWGYTMLTYIENKTLDKELMFSLQDVVVNGYNIHSFWASSLLPKTKTVTTINLSESDMELSGITTVDKIELYMRVYDNNDWFADDLIDTKYTIYPTGLSESEIESPDRPRSDGEYIVIDNEYVTFIIVDTYIDSIWGYTLVVFIENKTDDLELMFNWEDVFVNGIEIDPYWATSIVPDSKAIVTINFDESDFEDHQIVTVQTISFLLEVYDDNDWFAERLVEDTFEYLVPST
jgi:hypothetical protein